MEVGNNLPAIDLIIIIVYMFGILAAGIWVVRKEKMTSSKYFLAGRSLNWVLIGAALFASNIFVFLASASFLSHLLCLCIAYHIISCLL